MPQAGAQTFPFRWAVGIRVLATLFGGRSARIDVTPDTVALRYGVIFRVDIPRASIRSVEHTTIPRRWGIGAHGWAGRWLVNGSMQDLVTLTIDPRQPARTIGFRVRLRELTVSVENTDGFIAAVESAPAGR